MNEKEFNLLDEPWIKVILPSLEQKEVSLTDVFAHGHEYMALSGETPTQDAAVFRVLLAVALTVFYRYDENGEEDEISEDNDADEETVLDRWQSYWSTGRFPEQAVRAYLDKYRERFWLFHPETPFWQVGGLQYGTDYNIECLYGNMGASNNPATKCYFRMVDGEELYRMDYAQAARWLIHLNAYGVNVKKKEKAPGQQLTVGVGRLGQLGFVMANGENLFHTLMLNLCPLNGDEIWGLPSPVWERNVRTDQAHEISRPDNLPESYTIQSRRLLLMRDPQGSITGFRALGGDFYPVDGDLGEPMTLWYKKTGKNKGEKPVFSPKRHDPAVHAWREFPTLLRKDKDTRIPGIVKWMDILCRNGFLTSFVTFRMIGVTYADQWKCTYGNSVDDTIGMSAGLLTDMEGVWVRSISDEVDKCQFVATKALWGFSRKMTEFLYGDDKVKSNINDTLVSQYFFSIDHAFREWLAGINPEEDDRDDKMLEWEEQSCRCARKTVEDYIATLNTNIYAAKRSGKGLLTVPKILLEYQRELRRIYSFSDSVQQEEEINHE